MAVSVLALLLVFAPTALAGGKKTSSKTGYAGVAGNVQSGLGNNDPGAAAGPAPLVSNGPLALPFTGLDLEYVVLGGVALLAVGVAVRRAARP